MWHRDRSNPFWFVADRKDFLVFFLVSLNYSDWSNPLDGTDRVEIQSSWPCSTHCSASEISVNKKPIILTHYAAHIVNYDDRIFVNWHRGEEQQIKLSWSSWKRSSSNGGWQRESETKKRKERKFEPCFSVESLLLLIVKVMRK